MASLVPRIVAPSLYHTIPRVVSRPVINKQFIAAPTFRRSFATPAEQPRIRLGSEGI